MKSILLPSKAFLRSTKKYMKKNPEMDKEIQDTLTLLENNAFDPKLKTHKLKGIFKNSYACSVNNDIRIIFDFIDYEDLLIKESVIAIHLHSIGTHDEIY